LHGPSVLSVGSAYQFPFHPTAAVAREADSRLTVARLCVSMPLSS
jgi:hypothetical protein